MRVCSDIDERDRRYSLGGSRVPSGYDKTVLMVVWASDESRPPVTLNSSTIERDDVGDVLATGKLLCSGVLAAKSIRHTILSAYRKCVIQRANIRHCPFELNTWKCIRCVRTCASQGKRQYTYCYKSSLEKHFDDQISLKGTPAGWRRSDVEAIPLIYILVLEYNRFPINLGDYKITFMTLSGRLHLYPAWPLLYEVDIWSACGGADCRSPPAAARVFKSPRTRFSSPIIGLVYNFFRWTSRKSKFILA